jgi:hypothetical protein
VASRRFVCFFWKIEGSLNQSVLTLRLKSKFLLIQSPKTDESLKPTATLTAYLEGKYDVQISSQKPNLPLTSASKKQIPIS